MVERHGLIVNVVPARREEYLQLHAAVWPQVEEAMVVANITNYSIFIAGDTLIAYYEYIGEDFEADMKILEADPVSQEWWSHTDPCQTPAPCAPEEALWFEGTLVWHLD